MKKIVRKKFAENLFRSGSGSGRFLKSDPDPVKNRPDPQHWPQCQQYWSVNNTIHDLKFKKFIQHRQRVKYEVGPYKFEGRTFLELKNSPVDLFPGVKIAGVRAWAVRVNIDVPHHPAHISHVFQLFYFFRWHFICREQLEQQHAIAVGAVLRHTAAGNSCRKYEKTDSAERNTVEAGSTVWKDRHCGKKWQQGVWKDRQLGKKYQQEVRKDRPRGKEC
jgi:hypothetical protein